LKIQRRSAPQHAAPQITRIPAAGSETGVAKTVHVAVFFEKVSNDLAAIIDIVENRRSKSRSVLENA